MHKRIRMGFRQIAIVGNEFAMPSDFLAVVAELNPKHIDLAVIGQVDR